MADEKKSGEWLTQPADWYKSVMEERDQLRALCGELVDKMGKIPLWMYHFDDIEYVQDLVDRAKEMLK